MDTLPCPASSRLLHTSSFQQQQNQQCTLPCPALVVVLRISRWCSMHTVTARSRPCFIWRDVLVPWFRGFCFFVVAAIPPKPSTTQPCRAQCIGIGEQQSVVHSRCLDEYWISMEERVALNTGSAVVPSWAVVRRKWVQQAAACDLANLWLWKDSFLLKCTHGVTIWIKFSWNSWRISMKLVEINQNRALP